MHPLLDRRQVTREREAQAQPDPSTLGDHDDARLLEGLDRLRRELRFLHAASISEVAHGAPSTEEDAGVANWPINGARRRIARDRSHGSASLTVPAQTTPMTPVCAFEPYRAGGAIVNSGASPCTLVLADAQSNTGAAPAGAAAIWLSAAGTWDFLLGQAVWCGPVAVFASAGTTLTVAII